MEKIWDYLNKCREPNKETEIFNLLYLNNEFSKISEIKEQFDSWSIEDLESALEHLGYHPTMEDSLDFESDKHFALGQEEIIIESDFYKAADLRDGVFYIWSNTTPVSKKKRFF